MKLASSGVLLVGLMACSPAAPSGGAGRDATAGDVLDATGADDVPDATGADDVPDATGADDVLDATGADDVPDVLSADDVLTPADIQDAAAVRCGSDRECSALGLVCDLFAGRCVECNSANDCDGAGRICLASRCLTPVACTTSRMCPGQVCSTRLGYCVDCEADVDCSETERCRNNVCVARPRTCRSSRDCSDMGLVCDTARSQCVECVSENDCPMDRYCDAEGTCLVRTCRPNETECVSPTRVRVCDARGASQVESDCPAGQTCRTNTCQAVVCTPAETSCDPMTGARRRCRDDGGGYTPLPCGSGESCRAGICVARVCMPGAATCGTMNERRVCDPDGLATTTVPCGTAESCRAGACVAQSCTPGAASCASATERSVCDPDGLGATVTPCGTMQRCNAGACRDLACVPGSTTCVDIRTVRVCSSDGQSAMDTLCPSGSSCTGTMCSSWVCAPGTVTCPVGAIGRTICNPDGLTTRTEPCTAPANAGTPVCGSNNACAFTCLPAFGDCDQFVGNGCETPLSTSALHCGRCGSVCGSGQTCVAGVCSCPAGQTLCGAACVDTGTHSAHCGACGTVCTGGRFCVMGTCTNALPTRYERAEVPSDVTYIDACAVPGVRRLHSGVDDAGALVPMPFAFRYWAADLAAGAMVNVSSNGFMNLLPTVSSSLGGTIPSVSVPNAVIAAYWRDLVVGAPGMCLATVGAAPSRRWVVQWANTRPYGGGTTMDFEIVLHEGSNLIDLLYRTIETTSGTVGIENQAGNAGVSGCPTATSYTCAPMSNSRVRFRPIP